MEEDGQWLKVEVTKTEETGWVHSDYVSGGVVENSVAAGVGVIGMLLTGVLGSLFIGAISAFVLSTPSGQAENPVFMASAISGIGFSLFLTVDIMSGVALWKIVVAAVISLVLILFVAFMSGEDSDNGGLAVGGFFTGSIVTGIVFPFMLKAGWLGKGVMKSFLKVQSDLSVFERLLG